MRGKCCCCCCLLDKENIRRCVCGTRCSTPTDSRHPVSQSVSEDSAPVMSLRVSHGAHAAAGPDARRLSSFPCPDRRPTLSRGAEPLGQQQKRTRARERGHRQSVPVRLSLSLSRFRGARSSASLFLHRPRNPNEAQTGQDKPAAGRYSKVSALHRWSARRHAEE